MKVVILAGGLPSSLTEDKIPKPMVKVGERPLLWHIMKLYSMYGYNDFIICTGYRSNLIKEYFLNYYIYRSDITVDLQTNNIEIHNKVTEDWNVSIIDTGLESSTAKRVKMIQKILNNEDFILTYGDCVTDIDVDELVKTHKKSGLLMTMAVAEPTGRNAIVSIEMDGKIKKNVQCTLHENEAWSCAYSLVVSSDVFKYIESDTIDRFEVETIQKVAYDGMVGTYKHKGFWIPIETFRDRMILEKMWNERIVPWR